MNICKCSTRVIYPNLIRQTLNWKKLHTDIKAFAAAHELEVEELNTSYPNGQLTTYRMAEDSGVFFEIRHAKPISDYGSKVRVCSKTEREISIVSKTGWLGKQTIRVDGELTEQENRLIKELAKLIGSFSLTTKVINPEWPGQLRNQQCLVFECKQIELATAQLDSVREIYHKFNHQIGRQI